MLVDVEEGRLVRVRGDTENPDSRGFLCVRGQAAHEIIRNSQRLTSPAMPHELPTVITDTSLTAVEVCAFPHQFAALNLAVSVTEALASK
jgi:hypothetical protein